MKIKVGIIGVGTVGSSFLKLLKQQTSFFKKQFQITIEIYGIAAKSQSTLKKYKAPIVTQKPLELCQNPNIDVIIELAGGYQLPFEWIKSAMNHHKHIITANKALLAKYGHVLFPLAYQKGVSLHFEAAIGGGIPIVNILQTSLIGNNIAELACIINGTSNYILTEMTQKKIPFKLVLEDAQKKGYAEADSTFDVKGIDAAHKLALLTSLCFGGHFDFEKMWVEGIDKITLLDIEMAKELNYYIKLLGIIVPQKNKTVFAAVFPALVKQSHQLSNVQGVLNGVYVKGSATGPLLLTGAGAGGDATASSVLADLVNVTNIIKNKSTPYNLSFINKKSPLHSDSIDNLNTKFYLRFTCKDIPGAIAKISSILAKHKISINAIIQKPANKQRKIPIIVTTQQVKNKLMQRAVQDINQLSIILEKTKIIRFYH